MALALVFCAFFLALVEGYYILPAPQSLSTGRQTTILSSDKFKFKTNSQSQILTNALLRYHGIIFNHKTDHAGADFNFRIEVSDPSERLFLGVDESYSLDVAAAHAVLSAKTVFGALRGLETFAQVVDFNKTSKYFYISQIPIRVVDSPRFPWRGLLIDSARHYLDIPTIKRQIDGLAATKMNTLHWHIVDAESFPFQSTTYPFLSGKGAYAPEAIYTHKDVQEIIKYGLYRGVRVVPEFDIPGHAASWGAGDPSLVATCPNWSANINNIPLDPTKQHTFDVVKGLLNEVNSLIIDDTLHLGGDEVVFGCWRDDPAIVAWMTKHGMQTGSQLLAYFFQQLALITNPLNKTIVYWQDVIDDGINPNPSNSIIEIWRDTAELKIVIQKGYQSLLSAGWYLNQRSHTWVDFFNNEPFAGWNATAAEKKLLKGGEACMWGEQADSESIDPQVWPRTAAVGDRLWTSESTTNQNQARLRMLEHTCRLKQRGIRSTPLAPGYCPFPNKH